MDDDRGVSGALARLLDRGDLWLSRNLSDLTNAPVFGKLITHSRISARGLLIAFAALILVCAIPPLTDWLLRKCKCVAPNFRGEVIPKAYGIAILACAAPLLLLDAFMYRSGASDRLVWIACISVFAALGLLDDLIGDKQTKGLRGHLTAFLKDRRITTGLIKAVGGLLAAFAIGVALHRTEPLQILLVTGVVSLCANAMNLLDLRPGRACGVFCALALLLLFTLWRQSSEFFVPGLLYIFVPALVAWTHDADAHVMLGDTGSNLLGASIGLAVCLYFGPAVQVAALLLAMALHILAERRSITQIVEESRILGAIDRLTGVR